MKLWLARHGSAGDHSTDPAKERERPLLADGRKVVEAMAAEMKRQGEVPRVIYCSEYTRAVQTADIFGKAFRCNVDIIDELGPHAAVKALLARIADEDEDIARAMIVGHTDNLSPLYRDITGDDDAEDFVKAEVRRVKLDRESLEAEEKWRLMPSDLGLRDVE